MAFVVRPRVEIMLGPGDAIYTLESMLPTERAIYFLRNKGLDVAGRGAPATIQRQEAPFFRLVNSEGVIRDIDGLAWPRPFAEKGVRGRCRGSRLQVVDQHPQGHS